MNQTKDISNKDILANNLTVIDGPDAIWNDFLEQSANKPLRWIPSADDKFNSIDIEDDRLYVFTWAYPTYFTYKIITEDFVWDDGYVSVSIKNTCELKLADTIEPCFWKKVMNAILAGDDKTFRQLVPDNPNRKKANGILKSKSTKEIAEGLKKALEDNKSENNERYLSFGRIFLLQTEMIKTKGFIKKHPGKKYVLYMFVDDQYFQRIFKMKGLQYEK